MTDKKEIIRQEEPKVERIDSEPSRINVGDWYWVDEGEEEKWFGCVIAVGSNYVEIGSPPRKMDWSPHSSRIHLEDFDECCTKEDDPETVIARKVRRYEGIINTTAEKIRQLLNDVMGPRRLTAQQEPKDFQLARLSGETDLDAFEASLIRTREEDIPSLKKQMEGASQELARWLGAGTMTARAMTDCLKDVCRGVEAQIFNVSLYAGLTEKVATIKKGKPAPESEKLHIMQRLCYMDEESLIDYEAGGMEFRNLRQFDKWLAQPARLNRLMPFPRTIVAFRIRRNEKDRELSGDWSTDFIRLFIDAPSDKYTFLYIRNGNQLYRLTVGFNFGPQIFPGKHEFDGSKLYAKMFAGKVEEDGFITEADYEERSKANELYNQWKKEHYEDPGAKNPYEYDHDFSFYNYEPFDQSSVYHDDMAAALARKVQYYNRIVLIVQGLLDRSTLLHPHPPIQLWTPGGFESAVELVYDHDRALYAGPPPDFDAYRKKLNDALGEGSVTIGQEDYWERREADKVKARDWRREYTWMEKHQPFGNPGPGKVAVVKRWMPKAKKAVFRWERRRTGGTPSWRIRPLSDTIPVTLKVPAGKLFNVSAYKPGDFKQFFADPRTRAQYLKWADFMLTAEEYHAGNVRVGALEDGD